MKVEAVRLLDMAEKIEATNQGFFDDFPFVESARRCLSIDTCHYTRIDLCEQRSPLPVAAAFSGA